jgi:hypothetical protein
MAMGLCPPGGPVPTGGLLGGPCAPEEEDDEFEFEDEFEDEVGGGAEADEPLVECWLAKEVEVIVPEALLPCEERATAPAAAPAPPAPSPAIIPM